MSKTIILGDTHGRSFWKLISETEKWDKIVFIGDYFDSHDTISGNEQLYNFKEIVEFKKANPDKVIMLIGNHDFHYNPHMNERYSGFQNGHQYQFWQELEPALKIMQMAHIVDGKYLCTHAGVTKTWARNHDIDHASHNLVQSINDRFVYKPGSFKFQGRDNYGDNITQGPIWVRPASLNEDKLEGYIHVVGHTSVPKINLNEWGTDMILIDALGNKQYLVIEDGVASVKDI